MTDKPTESPSISTSSSSPASFSISPPPLKPSTNLPSPPSLSPQPLGSRDDGKPTAENPTSVLDLLNKDSWFNVHKAPCARQAYMTGIGSGFVFGGIQMILRASVWKSCSWAAGVFMFTSVAVWEMCRLQRGKEKDGMIRAMQIIDFKNKEREKKIEERREQLRLKKLKMEDEERMKKEAERSWWKPWS